jgi:hypothetical protein
LFSRGISGAEDIRVSSVDDGHDTYTEVFTAGATKIDIVSIVVIHNSLRQHGVILNLRLSQGRRIVGKEDHFSFTVRKGGEASIPFPVRMAFKVCL